MSVAIRPEKIRISREPIDLEVNATTGVISDVAYMGSQSIFKVRLNSGKEIRITQPNVSREMGNRLTWEDRVFLSWDADSCVVLVA